jgi:uncharacterized protein YndB with AHSA1/START domain
MNSADTIDVTENIICKKIVINAPASKVWKALTEKELISSWFMAPDNFKAEPGHTFHMTGTKDGKEFPHTCTVTEVISEKKLSYTWNMSAIDGETFVTWELEEQGTQTHLTLTHSGWDNASFNTADISRNDYINGWNYFVNKLKDTTESN